MQIWKCENKCLCFRRCKGFEATDSSIKPCYCPWDGERQNFVLSDTPRDTDAKNMRTLGEIIDMTQTGQKPEYDELRFTVEALRNLLMTTGMSGISLPPKENASSINWAEVRQEQNIKIFRAACLRSPVDYLGWNNNPDNPEYQKRIKESKRFAEGILKKMQDLK